MLLRERKIHVNNIIAYITNKDSDYHSRESIIIYTKH